MRISDWSSDVCSSDLPSIEIARRHAGEAGIANASFEVADAGDYNGDGFDLIAFFDCLHDMADPLGAAHHARQALRPEGTCMLVEPFAGDTVDRKSTRLNSSH